MCQCVLLPLFFYAYIAPQLLAQAKLLGAVVRMPKTANTICVVMVTFFKTMHVLVNREPIWTKSFAFSPENVFA